jgi:hypothetical protein
MKTLILFICLALSASKGVAAFAPSSQQLSSSSSPQQQSYAGAVGSSTTTTALFVSKNKAAPARAVVGRPKFNAATQKWERAANDNGVYPYDAVGSLLRHGPVPFLKRTLEKDTYEQAVLKYMASDNVGRAEATGNMDAYFNNPQDWAFQKMAERKGAKKVDYTFLSKKQAALTITWAVFVTPLATYVVVDTVQQFMSH